MKHFYYNPLDVACKSVVGGVAVGERLQWNVYALNEERGRNDLSTPSLSACHKPSQKAYLLLNKDGEAATSYEMTITDFGYSIELALQERGLYFYVFSIEGAGFLSCGYLQNGYLSEQPHGFLLTAYDPSYQTPEWFKGGVMYQIFPDRFCKVGTMPDITGRVRREDWGGEPTFRPNEYGKVLNNDFFGGNFKGIQSKLPYLQKLGVTVVYLNPIFEAASNHRYDTSDYRKTDRFLGTETDFKELVDAANACGIRLILDGVFNHTGDDSVYFNKYGRYDSVGAYQSQDSPYYSWYSFQEFPDKYSSWWGIDVLPEVNETSEAYQEFIFGEKGVLKQWLAYGIGGYRLDVADELPDFFLRKLRTSVKESNPNAVIIGEVWEDASDKIAYSQRREYLQGYELDSVMNYPMKEGIIRYMQTGDALALLHTVRVLIDHYPKQTVDCLMNILGTHDTARIVTVLGGICCNTKEEMSKKEAFLSEKDKEIAVDRLKTAAVLQFTLPGVPCVYYGDENGQEGHIDPFCRRCFDWENLNENLISFYARLGEIRKRYRDVFKDGVFTPLHAEDGLLFYKRQNKNGCVYVYVNHSSKRYLLRLPNPVTDILNDRTHENELEVEPYARGIFITNDEEKRER